MQRSDHLNPALGAAAVGLALIDAGSAEAKTRPIENVRLTQSSMPAESADAYQHGRALLAAGDTAGAIAAFRAALVESPQSIDALNGLGVAYDRLGRFDLSRSWYDTALAIDPTAVLVLNNLGYSLYLQGNYVAAIPLLQQVVDSEDPAARQAGQRVLTMIAARMRADAIDGRPLHFAETSPAAYREAGQPRREIAVAAGPHADAPVRRASAEALAVPVRQVEPPAARIEVTSSGEQRLVIGGPAPAPELVASLGDAAPMVMVADSWTPREEARVASRAATEERALAERARMASQLAQALAEVRHASPATTQMPAVVPDIDAEAAPVVPTPPSRTPETPVAALAAVVVRADPAPRRTAVRVDDAAPRRNGHRDAADGFHDPALTAWLLATRRPARPPQAAAAHDEPLAEKLLAFESDDSELNAFAARMRGLALAAEPATVSTEEAVGRLEGLLRRLRAA